MIIPSHTTPSIRKQFDSELLSDPHTRNLQLRIEAKLKSGTDVMTAPEEPETAEAAGNVIDLMQVLKERLQGRHPLATGHKASKPEHFPKREKPRNR